MKEIESQVHYARINALPPKTRLSFVQKVYGLTTLELLVTFAMVSLTQITTVVFRLHSAIGIVLFVLALSSSILIAILLHIYPQLAKQYPTNIIATVLFTLGESYVVACFTTYFTPSTVILAALLTLTLTVLLTIYTLTTKTDFTFFGSFLWIIGWGVLTITIFYFLQFTGKFNMLSYWQIFICIFLICIYGVYLVYDTEMILGGKRFSLGTDDYVLASIALYVDIINLFVIILKLISPLK